MLDAGVWIVLIVGGIIGLGLVVVLNRLHGRIPDTTVTELTLITDFLQSQKIVLQAVLGDQFGTIFNALLDAIKSLTNKTGLTKDDAVHLVIKAIDMALEVDNITLTDDQRNIVNSVVDVVVGMVIKKPVACARALSLM